MEDLYWVAYRGEGCGGRAQQYARSPLDAAVKFLAYGKECDKWPVSARLDSPRTDDGGDTVWPVVNRLGRDFGYICPKVVR